MLLKRSPDLKYSDVTPRQVYLNRRKFLYGMGLAGGVALAGKSLANLLFPSVRAYASTKLRGCRQRAVQHGREGDGRKVCDDIQQFL